MPFSWLENCLVWCQARTRQKVSQGEAWTPAHKCPVLRGILLGKDLEQLLGQEVLEEEGTCLLHTKGQWLTLSPGLPQHQVTSKVGGDAHGELGATCHQCPMAKAVRWPPRSHTAILDCGMGTSRWCLALSAGRSRPCFLQTVGMEQPLPELAGVPARNDSYPERRRGAEASL